MANNAIAIARQQKMFVVKETTKGTLAYPADANLVVAAGFGKINQQPSFSNSNEIKNSRDVIDRFADQTPAGSWSFPTYVRPSGSTGSIPQEDALLDCFCGSKTINASTSVVYGPAMEKDSCSIWIKKGHTVFWARGATVGQTKIALGRTGGAQWDWSGQFMEMGWAGTDLIDGAALTDATSVPVDDGKKFTVGCKVEFEESGTVYSNSDSGYTVTAISSNTLTISPGLETDLDDDSTIRGWLPDGTETGTPLEARKGKANIAGSDFPVQSLEATFGDQPKYLEDEITTTTFPEEYAEVQRNISFSMGIYFRENDVSYFYDGYNSNENVLKMIIGDTAGSILTIQFNKALLEVPEVAESDPTIALNMNGVALGTSGEDSYSITYT